MIPSLSQNKGFASSSAPHRAGSLHASIEDAIDSGNLAAANQFLTSQRALGVALDVAINRNVPALALLSLQKGFVPDWRHFRDASPEMRSLLTYARRKHILYPNGVGGKHYSALDEALWNHDTARANELLRNGRTGMNVPRDWANAVQARRLDVLRALLLLGEAEKNRDFRLREDPSIPIRQKISDDNLIRVMKEVPYHPPKLGRPKNFNGDAYFNGRPIVCRHMAYYWAENMSAHRKFDYGAFASPDSIANHVQVSEVEISNMENLAAAFVVSKSDFGRFIAAQFKSMEQAGSSIMRMLMETTNHGIGIALRIKRKNEETCYVVDYFDPNFNTKVRSASNSANYFETRELDTYIDAAQWETYFPERDTVCMMFVCPPENSPKGSAGERFAANPNRRAASFLADGQIDTTIMWHLMRGGFSGNLRDLEPVIAGMPENRRRELISVSCQGYYGLYAMLQLGHAHAIMAFTDLLRYVPTPDCAEIIMHKGADDTPGLYWSFANGHDGAVSASAGLFRYVPKTAYPELIAAKDAAGTPGLFIALHNGHAKAVDAFVDLLKHAPRTAIIDLLSARNAQGISGLAMALLNGHAKAVSAYARLLRFAPEAARPDLIAAKDQVAAFPALLVAMEQGNDEAIVAFGDLLKQVPEELRTELVLAKDADQLPALTAAMRFKQAGSIKAYGSLLQLIPQEGRFSVLSNTITSKGDAALLEMMTQGDEAGASAFFGLLDLLPDERQRVALLTTILSDEAIDIFSQSLKSGNDVALRMFGKLFPTLPAKRQAEILTRTAVIETLTRAVRAGHTPAVTAYAEFGIPMALKCGHVNATEAIASILGAIANEQERRALLGAVHDEKGLALFSDALNDNNAGVILAFGNLLPYIHANDQARMLHHTASRALRNAMVRQHAEAITAYAAVGTALAASLSPDQRKTLLKKVWAIHGQRGLLGKWSNHPFYIRIKNTHPACYEQFKAMKNALK